MKKCIILLVLAFSAIPYLAAQEGELNGYYMSKRIKILYQKGAPGKDDVSFIEYAPFDELQRKAADLQRKLGMAEKEKSQLAEEANKLQLQVAHLRQEVQLVKERDSTSQARLAENERSLRQTESLNDSLQSECNNYSRQIDVLARDLDCYRHGMWENVDSWAVRSFLSSSRISNDLTIQPCWQQYASLGQQYEILYTAYFSKLSPLALNLGFGINRYRFSAQTGTFHETVEGNVDLDNHDYVIYYCFNDIVEQVELTWLNVPIHLHLGRNHPCAGLQPWMETGFTFSFPAGAASAGSFTGSGTYSAFAYYPAWDMRVDDLPLLGVGVRKDAYDGVAQWQLHHVVVCGDFALGVSLPLHQRISLSVGGRCAYTLTPVSQEQDAPPSGPQLCRIGQSNLLGGHRTRIFSWGVSLGLTFLLD